jgi:hypothetical protein
VAHSHFQCVFQYSTSINAPHKYPFPSHRSPHPTAYPLQGLWVPEGSDGGVG